MFTNLFFNPLTFSKYLRIYPGVEAFPDQKWDQELPFWWHLQPVFSEECASRFPKVLGQRHIRKICKYSVKTLLEEEEKSVRTPMLSFSSFF